ncbi:MAG: L-aspartate oxidase [Deltaproteobacteria bacterium]|nr:L-aspartate oxidase [Deltaproteobacteria bacterium]MBN2673699.1 L-aspartate oxidase [Deltaproteobacteria bacterium]
MRFECDYLVIGTGIAGLTFAKTVADYGRVILLTKQSVEDSATNEAQGGVASVIDATDSFESHIEDTISVGRGINNREVVEICVKDGPARISELIALGTQFTHKKDEPEALDLGREGGHSARRIVHAADATGKEMIRALVETVRNLDNVAIYEQHMAVNLIVPNRQSPKRVCKGVYALDKKTGEVHSFVAPVTVLATGGLGKVYLYTSNPDVATGDGVAMGYRAGAKVANMEFFQFHPTILYHPEAKSVLISEAVRGEGGILRDIRGRAFMADYHPQKELAPRDVVARAIDDVLKRTGDDHVWLDVTHLDADFLRERFPNIYATCAKFGIDIASVPIPVVPGAHYSCGGLVTDTYGRTSIPGLFAVGEVACTGLHGANRLASNSLLEGLVFAHRAAELLIAHPPAVPDYENVEEWSVGDAIPSDEHVVVSQDWDELRRFMWNYVGIVRSDRRLERAQRRHAMLQEEIKEYYWQYVITSDLLELRNISTVAHLIITCAGLRQESRGLHFTSDYPKENPSYESDTIISRYDDV